MFEKPKGRVNCRNLRENDANITTDAVLYFLSSLRLSETDIFALLITSVDTHIIPYKNFTCNLTYQNNISCANCFSSIREMKTSYMKGIFSCESILPFHMGRTCLMYQHFHVRNFEPSHFTCELRIAYVKTFRFFTLNENFTSENVPFQNHPQDNTRTIFHELTCTA